MKWSSGRMNRLGKCVQLQNTKAHLMYVFLHVCFMYELELYFDSSLDYFKKKKKIDIIDFAYSSHQEKKRWWISAIK